MPMEKSEITAKERVQEAAVELFYLKGYGSTSVREIVEKAGVSKPVLYYYFKNKEDLLRSIMLLAHSKLNEITDEIVAAEGNFLEKVTMLYQKLAQGVSEHSDIFHLLHSLITRPTMGASGEIIREFPVLLHQTIKTIFLEGVETGELRDSDPDQAAFMFMGFFNLLFLQDGLYFNTDEAGDPASIIETAYYGVKL